MNRTEPVAVGRYWLRVPASEWLEVKHGVKDEYRNTRPSLSLSRVQKPTPVIAFTVSANNFDSRLMVIEEAWKEPLGAISEESLRREGFETLREFKTHWTSRRRRRFNPLLPVYVYRVRHLEEGEERKWADRIFTKLYPEEYRGF